ncbi:probable calcium-binding protein CML47 [Durio zibethinus]|uniref:Probable calcium-binding protein CML47 n=1 Tax=Durio zibethinus TaxID=66656 RepID=A0A6P5YAF4_DURZI|nr:probable calcium-binding protein CML47 [Durio zibethinus]
MEKTAIKQVRSDCCYSFIIIESRFTAPSSSKKIEKSSSSATDQILLCGINLLLVILNMVILLQDFFSSFHCMVSIFKSFLRIPSCTWTAWAATRRPTEKCCSNSNNIDAADHQIKSPRDQTETKDHRNNLTLLELKKVIQGGSCEIQENESTDKIAGLFAEEEPSIKEVKEAFDVFDENKDGFIDAKDLGNVLFLLGFMEASEEDCKRMIKSFDDNLDGRIDFNEFIKVMERSFS